MILRWFRAVRFWEDKHKIGNSGSIAYALFAIVLPCVFVFLLSVILESFSVFLSRENTFLIAVGICVFAFVLLWMSEFTNKGED
ncbi:hypothetical protein C7964_103626 [Loktanella sp. PT4BL]|jgi:hypothetical protein|nr:hypothetical protein C7964_103626 [Loktanella sp. PT4BL]